MSDLIMVDFENLQSDKVDDALLAAMVEAYHCPEDGYQSDSLPGWIDVDRFEDSDTLTFKVSIESLVKKELIEPNPDDVWQKGLYRPTAKGLEANSNV